MKRFYALCVSLAITVFVLNGFMALASNQDSFWEDAAQMGMAEVALSNLALQKTQNEQVRSFAQKMVDDHTAANDELKQMATGKNLTLPTDMDAKHQAAMTKLSGMTGADFDRAYMKQMVKDHEAAVKLFQRQSDRGTDADLKAFAAKHLPTLQGHLEMARTTYDGVRNIKSKTDGGGNDNRDANSRTENTNGGNMNSNTSMNSNLNTNSNRRTNSNRSPNRNTNTNANTNANGNAIAGWW